MKFDFTKIPNIKIDQLINVKNKKEKTTITIVTPFYNAYETFEDTYNSIVSQTYPFFEWIIVDDGSKDKKSLEILDRLSKLDKRIKVFHKENGGPAQARDYGISKSCEESEYVYFIDTDDMLEKTGLECLYITLSTHPEYSFIYPVMTNFGAAEFFWNKYFTVSKEKKENVIPIASMVRKKDLLEVGCFGIKEKSMYEDWNLWLKLLKAEKKPIKINDALFWYRFNTTGELSRAKKNHQNAMKYVEETAAAIKKDVKSLQFPIITKPGILESFESYDNLVLPQYKKDNRKTILFIVPWYKTGGADLFNLEIVKRIDKTKYRSIFVSTTMDKNNLKQQFKLYADEVYDMPAFLETKNYLSFVDHIIQSRNVETIFLSNSTYGYAMLPFIRTKYKDITVIDYIHSVDKNDNLGSFGKFTADFASYIDMTYTCNNFTTNQIIDDFGKDKNDIDTLYIGADHERFDKKKFNRDRLEQKYDILPNKTVITFLARFSEEKRPLLFLEIAKKMQKDQNLYFVMVGDGPLRSKIVSKASKLNNVRLLPLTDKAEEIYAISDITLNCSRLEGLALTSYESLSMNVPVISSDVGGQKELIDEKVGVIVPYSLELSMTEDVSNYVTAIEKVIANLDDYKKEARKAIATKFNLEMNINKIEKIVDTIKRKPNEKFDNKALIYELYINTLSTEHNWLTKTYIEEEFGVKQEEEACGMFATIENKFKPFLSKYNLIHEYALIERFLKGLLQFIKGTVKIILYILPCLLSIFKSILKIIYKKITLN